MLAIIFLNEYNLNIVFIVTLIIVTKQKINSPINTKSPNIAIKNVDNCMKCSYCAESCLSDKATMQTE